MAKQYITAKLWLNSYQHIKVDGYVHYTIETNHKSDADGNRGYLHVEVDEITDVKAYDKNDDDIDLTDEGIQEAKEALERAFLEQGS